MSTPISPPCLHTAAELIPASESWTYAEYTWCPDCGQTLDDDWDAGYTLPPTPAELTFDQAEPYVSEADRALLTHAVGNYFNPDMF